MNIRYFKQILFETFRPEHLIKLANSFTNWNKDTPKPKDKVVPEATGLNQSLRCFEVYGQAICRYAHPAVALKLLQMRITLLTEDTNIVPLSRMSIKLLASSLYQL